MKVKALKKPSESIYLKITDYAFIYFYLYLDLFLV